MKFSADKISYNSFQKYPKFIFKNYFYNMIEVSMTWGGRRHHDNITQTSFDLKIKKNYHPA